MSTSVTATSVTPASTTSAAPPDSEGELLRHQANHAPRPAATSSYEHALVTMRLGGVSMGEILAEARGGIGGYYDEEEDLDLSCLERRGLDRD